MRRASPPRQAPPPGGLYLPETLLDPDAATARYQAFGARLVSGDEAP